MAEFPRLKAAAVQAASVFLNREATTAKACRLIEEAGRNRADIVAFPEVCIPGFPYWNWIGSPLKSARYFRELILNSVVVPSDVTEQLGEAARRARCYVVIGVNELGSHSMAENYNTALIFDREGQLIAKHRKTMPTFPEKLTWSFGDGTSLRVHKTEIGKLGVLNCGENGNSLLRYALIAQGEQVHVANYPALAALSEAAGMYDFWKGVEIRTAAHAFEGKLFNIVSSAVLDEEAKTILCDTPDKKECFRDTNNSLTAIYGPSGMPVGGPVAPDAEGIAYADIDLSQILAHKLFHDIAGNYMRADIVSLNLNRRPLRPIWETGGSATMDTVVADVTEQLRQLLEEVGAVRGQKTLGALSRAVAELAERSNADWTVREQSPRADR